MVIRTDGMERGTPRPTEDKTKVLEKLTPMEKKLGMSEAERESELLVKLLSLPPDYNKFELPVLSTFGFFIPIPIRVSVRIRNIRGIDGLNEEITMEVDLVTRWVDYAIRRHNMDNSAEPDVARVLDSLFLKEIWYPKLFFSKTVSVTRPDLHGSYITPRPVKLAINPRTGIIEMASRIVLRLYCPMNFEFYPADTQTCRVRIRSYSDSRSDVALDWEQNEKGVPQAYLFNRGHANFDIHLHDVLTEVYIETSATNTSTEYTILQFSLSTRRKLSFHVMQTFAPSVFLLVITWLSFFIPMELLEARIGISMTILLTMVAMFSGIKEYTPQVSYIKAIDIWMLVCVVFVFLTLFQFTFLMWLRHLNDKAHGKAIEATMNKVEHPHPEEEKVDAGIGRRRDKTVEEYLRVELLFRIVTKAVETYGFLILSGGFLLFNLAYWPWLLKSSQYGSFIVDPTHNQPIQT